MVLEDLFEKEGINAMKKIFPILKFQTFLTPYFVEEKDGLTEKSRERIRKTQKTIIKKLIKNTELSLKEKTPRTRNIRRATAQEERRYRRATKGFLSSTVHNIQTRLLQYGTPHWKEGFMRDLGAKIGKRVMFGGFNVFDTYFPRLLSIGTETILGNGTVISCHQIIDKDLYVGPVSIGENSLIAAGTFILPGVTVGNNAVVVPGILTFDVPDNHVAIGQPENVLFELKKGSGIVKEKRAVRKTGFTIWDYKEIISPFEMAWKNLWLQIQKSPMLTNRMRVAILKYLGVKVGKHVRIEPGVNFDPYWPEKIEIGDGSILKKDSFIATHEGIPGQFREGNVKIGKNVLLESGTGVLPGVEIGDNAEVLPYTFVATNIDENAQVEGIPARKTGEAFDIRNFLNQQFQYTAEVWDEIQEERKKTEEANI